MFGRKRPIAYYAHSMRIYGSQIERQQARRIRRHGYKVINPNGLLSDCDWKADAVCLIQRADVVICTEYLDYVGKGVDWELNLAFALCKPAYVLRGGRLFSLSLCNVRYVGLDWAIQWAKIIL